MADLHAARMHVRAQLLSEPTFAVWFPLAVYGLTRLVTVATALAAAPRQVALSVSSGYYHVTSPSPGSPGYATLASNWDGQWYTQIALHGYPRALVWTGADSLAKSVWAFYPGYPTLVRFAMSLVDGSFVIVAPFVSTLLGAAAVVLVYRLVRETTSRFAACATVTGVCTFVSAPILQFDQAESLALFLICATLWALRRRRYGLVGLTVLLTALSRPVVLPLAVVVAAHAVARGHADADDPFPAGDRWTVGLLVLFTVASAAIWPAIAAIATGVPDVFTKTEQAWSTYHGGLFPMLSPSTWQHLDRGSLIGILLVALVVCTAACRPGSRAWSTEVRTWAWAYPLYLLCVTGPGISWVRFLVLAFPLMWPVPDIPDAQPHAIPRTRNVGPLAAVLTIGAVGLILQGAYISGHWIVTPAEGHQPASPSVTANRTRAARAGSPTVAR